MRILRSRRHCEEITELKSEPQLELTCLGLRVRAKGSLAVVILALLFASWMALRALHIS
jgi:hypothetical protein